MPISKAHLFGRDEIRAAEVAKMLSHPARVAILRRLARSKECICGELVDDLPLAQATISQHLKELKSAGFISGEVDGPRSCYCLDREVFQEALDFLVEFFEASTRSRKLQTTRVIHAAKFKQ